MNLHHSKSTFHYSDTWADPGKQYLPKTWEHTPFDELVETYILWSENDTRSEDYRVRYATLDSPTGKLHIPEDNHVITKDPQQQIYGTGHNSVINIPGTDQWYIVYHRFTRPGGITMGRAAGFHREVCNDKLEFDENEDISKVIPTLSGISSI